MNFKKLDEFIEETVRQSSQATIYQTIKLEYAEKISKRSCTYDGPKCPSDSNSCSCDSYSTYDCRSDCNCDWACEDQCGD